MESGISKKKIRVVWLCHFANQEMKQYFKTPQVAETSPWIGLLIELFKNRDDVEVHIVAPNVFTNNDCSFYKDGIYYNFYKWIPLPQYSKFIKLTYSLLQIEEFTNFWWIKRKIGNYLKKINPDIIHLHGAEMPYYSAGVIPYLDKFPVFVTIQGFIRNTSQFNRLIRKRISIEEEIIKKTKHFGVRTDEMNNIILGLNPNAILHFHNYPYTIPKNSKNQISEFDIVFFARVTKDKGIEDLFEAISIVKQMKPDVSLHVIGGATKSYKRYLIKKTRILKIERNVTFLGFLPTQNEIYNHAIKAEICVLPTYHDTIPGTIIESMFMKIPVISYSVGGIPELNEEQESVMLSNKNDIRQLAENIISLLFNPNRQMELAKNGYETIKKRFNNSEISFDILKAYEKIISQ